MSKTLFAGPFVGEFGWELFVWQGFVRRHAKEYDKVIVSSRTSSRFLYEDFYDEFVDCNPDTYACSQFNCLQGGFENKFKDEYSDAIHLFPTNQQNVRHFFPDMNQDLIVFKSEVEVEPVDLVFHARNVKGFGEYKEARNWPPDKWEKLASTLAGHGHKIASIGTSDFSIHVPGTLNYLDKDLSVVCALLNRSKMIIGQSSGPMHFATLCKCPQLVWTSNEPGLGKDNKKKYEVDWNPFDTPVYVYEESGWNPDVSKIINSFEHFESQLI